MLMLLSNHAQLGCDGYSRRDFLQAGTLAIGGLTLPWLFEQQAALAETVAGASNSGRARTTCRCRNR